MGYLVSFSRFPAKARCPRWGSCPVSPNLSTQTGIFLAQGECPLEMNPGLWKRLA